MYTFYVIKIIDLDFGENLKEHGEIVKKAKESLEEIAELKDIIAKAQIIPPFLLLLRLKVRKIGQSLY